MSEDELMSDAPPAKRQDKGKGKQVYTNGDKVEDDTNLPWVEKYRPKGLEDVVSHQDIISTSKICRLYSLKSKSNVKSRKVYRPQSAAPSLVLWSSWDGKDISYSGHCSQTLWRKV